MNQNLTIEKIQHELQESWKTDHSQAMMCRDLEDLIKLGLRIFTATEAVEHAYCNAVRADIVKHSWKTAKAIESLYVMWEEPCAGVFAKVEELSRMGFAVDGADQLRDCQRRCLSKLAIDVKGTREALQQAESGKTKPAAEVMRELRRRIHREGA